MKLFTTLFTTLLVLLQIWSQTTATAIPIQWSFSQKRPSYSMAYSTPQNYSSTSPTPIYSYISSTAPNLNGWSSSNTIIGNGNIQYTGLNVLGNADQPLNILSLNDIIEAVHDFLN